MGFTDSVSDGAMIEKPEGFPVGTSDVAKLGLIEKICLVLLIISNLEKNLAVSKVCHFVYLIELWKAYVNIPRFSLMRVVLNTTHLELMNQNMKESSRELQLV